MIELAVFDLAGTLVRDDGAVEAAFLDALRHVDALAGAPDDELVNRIRASMGRSKITVFRELLGEEHRAQAARDAFESAYAARIEAGETAALPTADAALGALREAGVKVAVTTGFSSLTRDQLLESLGWQPLVSLALSPSEELRGRPAPDLVLAAVIQLRVDDVRAAAVAGDTVNDLLAGHRAGAGIVAGVLSGAHGPDLLESAPHTHLVPSVGDVAELILELRGLRHQALRTDAQADERVGSAEAAGIRRDSLQKRLAL
jgi:phosphonatase-like hydrolase